MASPARRIGKGGAVYKPNHMDPNRISRDPKLDKPAGVQINYGYPRDMINMGYDRPQRNGYGAFQDHK